MSKIFSTPIMIVVSTTAIVDEICGMITRQKICTSVAPSMRAASRVSSGTPFTADDSSTIANPTWVQIMITMSSSVLSRKSETCNQATGSPPNPVQTALSRPIWAWLAGRHA